MKKFPKKSNKWIYFILMFLTFLTFTSFPLMLLFFLCFIPTMILAVADDDPTQYLSICLGLMNASAFISLALYLWAEGSSLGSLGNLLTTPPTWLVLVLANGVGILLPLFLRPIIKSYFTAHMKRRFQKVDEKIKDLEQTWDDLDTSM